MAPPPRISWAALRQAELGFTLQTLIVTAAVVLMAAVAATVLWGVTRGASDSAADAGRVGTEARCAPNEVRDPDLESKGRKGSNRILDAEITADAIGCYPVCGTWEYYDLGLAAAGTGGPDGGGGIYSSDIGCFAPCYWNHDLVENAERPVSSQTPIAFDGLSYYDNNRPPERNQIRLGINYAKSLESETDSSAVEYGDPTVFRPLWIQTQDADPDAEDQLWEFRADSYKKVCTTFSTLLASEHSCSSAWESCRLPVQAIDDT